MIPEVDFSVPGAVLIGLGVGFLAGFLGVGGGFVMIPLVNGFLGVPMNVVAGSSLCQISGTSLAGLLRHRRYGNFDGRVAVILTGGTLCGTAAGVEIVEWLKSLGWVQMADGAHTSADLWLRWIFLAVLAVIFAAVYRETARSARGAKEQDPSPKTFSDPSDASDASDSSEGALRTGLLSRVGLPFNIRPVGGRPVSVLLVAYCGVLVGLAQGVLGIGGGVLLIPVLVYAIGVATHAAVGTSLLVILVGGLFGTLLHALAGNVHLPLVLALLVPSTFGSQLGAVAANRLAGHRLRRCFALVVAAAALLVAGRLARTYGLITWWPGVD